ncbi:MAG TPA: hypothetical protein VK540_28730 [Polyangiaceae bacterium]|nr:hypothetical protein [Polyangiaceae bacterium]
MLEPRDALAGWSHVANRRQAFDVIAAIAKESPGSDGSLFDSFVLLTSDEHADTEHGVAITRPRVAPVSDRVEARATLEQLTNAAVREFWIARPPIELVAHDEVTAARLSHEQLNLLSLLALFVDCTFCFNIEPVNLQAARFGVRGDRVLLVLERRASGLVFGRDSRVTEKSPSVSGSGHARTRNRMAAARSKPFGMMLSYSLSTLARMFRLA